MRTFIRHLNLVMAGALLLQVGWAVGELAGQSPLGWGFYQLAVTLAEMEQPSHDRTPIRNTDLINLPNSYVMGEPD